MAAAAVLQGLVPERHLAAPLQVQPASHPQKGPRPAAESASTVGAEQSLQVRAGAAGSTSDDRTCIAGSTCWFQQSMILPEDTGEQ